MENAKQFIDKLLSDLRIDYEIQDDNTLIILWININNGKHVIVAYNENCNTLWLSYTTFWLKLELDYELNELQINELMNGWMGLHYNLNGFKTKVPSEKWFR